MKQPKEAILAKILELSLSKRQKFTEKETMYWCESLMAKFSNPDDILKAIEYLIWNGDDFPTLQKVAEVIKPKALDMEIEAAKRWSGILDAINRDAGKIHFNPDTQQAIDIVGGISVIRRSNERDLVFTRNKFIKVFAEIKTHRNNLIMIGASKNKELT